MSRSRLSEAEVARVRALWAELEHMEAEWLSMTEANSWWNGLANIALRTVSSAELSAIVNGGFLDAEAERRVEDAVVSLSRLLEYLKRSTVGAESGSRLN